MSWRAAAVIILVFAFGAWWMTAPRNTWRYKMTVEVDTPDGPRSGFAVREVHYRSAGYGFLGESRPQHDLKGQAVLIDLGRGKVLYGLLRSPGRLGLEYGARIADSALGRDSRVAGWPKGELYPTAPATPSLSGTDPLPTFVTFADPRDPGTVQLVDPRHLEQVFGRGYRLRRVSIAIVDDGITTGIDHRLPWLSAYPEPSLKPGSSLVDQSLAVILKHGDFRQGAK